MINESRHFNRLSQKQLHHSQCKHIFKILKLFWFWCDYSETDNLDWERQGREWCWGSGWCLFRNWLSQSGGSQHLGMGAHGAARLQPVQNTAAAGETNQPLVWTNASRFVCLIYYNLAVHNLLIQSSGFREKSSNFSIRDVLDTLILLRWIIFIVLSLHLIMISPKLSSFAMSGFSLLQLCSGSGSE